QSLRWCFQWLSLPRPVWPKQPYVRSCWELSCSFQSTVEPESCSAMAMCAMAMVAVEPHLSGDHYRRAEASGDRIISANDCLILPILQRDVRTTKEAFPMLVINSKTSEGEDELL